MRYLHPGLWIAASLPLVYLLTQLGLVLSGQANNLGGDPGEAIMSELGRYALWLLIATLAITPLRGIFPRLTPLVRSRRMLGLWVMAYAVLHLVAYAVLVLGLDFSILWQDISQKPYAIAGAVAFVGLLPLAVTSTQGWQRKLGRRWKRLHKLSYPIAAVAWIHFLWQVRSDYAEAAVYALLIGLVLLYRTPAKRFFHLSAK